jgi:hypothetical protein
MPENKRIPPFDYEPTQYHEQRIHFLIDDREKNSAKDFEIELLRFGPWRSSPDK